MAVGHKYAIMQLLSIPTEEAKDPEHEHREVKPRPAPPPVRKDPTPQDYAKLNVPPKQEDAPLPDFLQEPGQEQSAFDIPQPTVTGIIERITQKTGERNGSPWTKFGYLINGAWFGTFDTKIAEKMASIKGTGKEAVVVFEQKGDFRTIVECEEIAF
jgi:hypothetical protein